MSFFSIIFVISHIFKFVTGPSQVFPEAKFGNRILLTQLYKISQTHEILCKASWKVDPLHWSHVAYVGTVYGVAVYYNVCMTVYK